MKLPRKYILLLIPSLLILVGSPNLYAQGPPTEVEFGHAFHALQQSFRAKVTASLGDESFADPSTAALWISKAFLAQSASSTFNRSNVRAQAEIGPLNLPDPPTQPIRTGPMDCSPTRGCRSNCQDDCTHDTFLGKVTDPFCLTACSVEKAGCEALKASEKGACEGVKTLFAEKKVGELSFSGLSAEGRGDLRNLTLSIADDLSRAQISGTLGATISLRGSMRFRPEPLVQVGTLCVELSGEVPRVQVSAPEQSLTLQASLGFQETPDGVSIQLSFDDVEPEVKIVGNPFIDFILSNPQNFFQCSLPTAVGLLGDAFQGEFPIQQKVKIPGGNPLPIGAVAVLDGISLTPRLTATAVGLVQRAPAATVADVHKASPRSNLKGDRP